MMNNETKKAAENSRLLLKRRKKMDKKIKESKRGLTFSFTPTETMQIGSRYDYIISNSGIRIVPSKTGRYTVSRKRSGSGWNPLIDLRNREVLDAIAGMENIRLHITADSILVSGEAEHAVVLQFPRTLLAHARKVVGISDSCAVSRILEGTQITLDEYLASSKAPLDIAAIQKDLPDIYSVVSLFSGAGILDWPFFKDERFSIQYAIDYDAGACQTYRQNIGMHIVHGDVHKAFTAEGFPLDNAVKAPDVRLKRRIMICFEYFLTWTARWRNGKPPRSRKTCTRRIISFR